MSVRKSIFSISLLALVLIFSGCGYKSPNKEASENSKESSFVKNSGDNYEKTLPQPTGKNKDVLDAILKETESEEADIAEEENEALSSIDDSAETDDFGQALNENEL